MPAALGAARAVRSELYGCRGPRADALFDLVDAASCGGAADSLPHRSLVPAHRRGHGSVDAALRDGAVDAGRMRGLLARRPLACGLPACAVDVSVVARCAAIVDAPVDDAGRPDGPVDRSFVLGVAMPAAHMDGRRWLR